MRNGVFLSYCHEDEKYLSEIINILKEKCKEGLIEFRYDGNIKAGARLYEEISEMMGYSAVFLIALSNNYYTSKSCQNELNEIVELSKSHNNVLYIPIVVQDCPWLKDDKFNQILTLPKDGKAISSFKQLKDVSIKVCENIITVVKEQDAKLIEANSIIQETNNPIPTFEFKEFLNNTGFLEQARSGIQKLNIDEIYVFPNLTEKENSESIRRMNEQEFLDIVKKNPKILISGDQISGKTTILKIVSKKLIKEGLYTVFIQNNNENNIQGNPKEHLIKALRNQYDVKYPNEVLTSGNVIVIIDNIFRLNENKVEDYLENLSRLSLNIILSCDTESNFRYTGKLHKLGFQQYSINQLNPKQISSLVRKWLQIENGNTIDGSNSNSDLLKHDENYDQIVKLLGKTLGKGIMPSYPFYVISLLASLNNLPKDKSQEITSHGYCYQALIYIYLRKNGVVADQIESYINFLTELAYYIYKEGGFKLSTLDFELFKESYNERYNLETTFQIMEEKLRLSNISGFDSLGNYSFTYPYLYYFFISKYFSEDITKHDQDIEFLLDTVHKNSSAHILIFLSFHCRSDVLSKKIISKTESLYSDYNPISLKISELEFFTKNIDSYIELALPDQGHDVEQEREIVLSEEQFQESVSKYSDTEISSESNDEYDQSQLSKEIIQYKMCNSFGEIIGSVISNRFSSLPKDTVAELYQKGTAGQLRMIGSIYSQLENTEGNSDFVETLSDFAESMLNEKLEKGENKYTDLEKKNIARNIVRFLIFTFTATYIDKIIKSIGSTKIVVVAKKLSETDPTPINKLLFFCMQLWYKKNLDSEGMKHFINDGNVSPMAKKILEYFVVRHCRLHYIEDKQLNLISNIFNIKRDSIKQGMILNINNKQI